MKTTYMQYNKEETMKLHESNGFRGAVARKLSLSLAIVAIAGVAAAAKTNYVDSAAVDDTGDGTSWGTAKKTIQAAIDIAEKNDTVLIKAGTYQISSALTIAGEAKDIELRGATGNPVDVVVDAQGLCPCLVSLNTNQIIVSSITFENGSSTVESDVAGGITAADKSMVTNCIVKSCYHGVTGKNVTGGGIRLTAASGSNPNNTATHWPSSRRYLPQVVDTVVKDCAVYVVADASDERKAQGGGVYLEYHNTAGLTVQNCAVTNFSDVSGLSAANIIKIAGGGAYLYAGSHTDDTFQYNSLEPLADTSGYLGTGAGVFLAGYSSSDASVIRRGTLSGSLVSGNSSHGCGAGVGLGSYATIDGCSVVSNMLSHGKVSGYYQIGGAGIYVSGSYSEIANSLVAENISTNDANAVSYSGTIDINEGRDIVIRDCVIRDNALQNAGALSCISAGGLLVSNCVMFANAAIDEVSAIRFYTNQKSLDTCSMALITDCYVISNSSPGKIITYYGAQSNKEGVYAAPLTVRNCLFAGNQANTTKAWGLYAVVTEKGTVSRDDLLTFDHCTFAKNRNAGSNKTFVQYNTYSPAHVFFRGCALWENRHYGSIALSYVSTDFSGTHFANCYADVTNTAFVCTAENGNIGGKAAGDVKFVDADNLDFRLTSGSCLINKGGAFEEWMGDGRKNSVQDMGAGYVIGSLGKYGVTVGRLESKPRRSGSASDIGCSEFWFAPGLLLLVK